MDLFDVGQFLIVLEEEGQVLIGDVNVRVPPQPLVLLLSVTPTREGIFVDLERRIKQKLTPLLPYQPFVLCHSWSRLGRWRRWGQRRTSWTADLGGQERTRSG